MSLLASAIDMFEDESERLLWLPAVTLGYLYHLSGARSQFALAVLSIGGASMLGDMFNSELVEQTPTGPKLRDDTLGVLWSYLRPWKVWPVLIVFLGYFVSAIIAPIVLSLFFDHTNLILVALGLTWCGVVLIVFLNTDFDSAVSG